MKQVAIPVDGGELFAVEVGDGPAVAVLLHGGPGASHDYLRPQFDALASNSRRLLYYDQRGSGRSSLVPGRRPGGYQEHVADLDAVRAHLGLARVDLVGYSWGGLLALLYAVAHPERVGRLALVSPAPACARDRDRMRANLAAAAGRPEVAALRASLDPQDRQARFALAVAGYFYDPRRAVELTRFVVKSAVEEAVWRSLGDYDLLPALAALAAPAFVAHGADDPIPLDSALATARALAADALVLARCGHVPYVEAADRLFPALGRFLDGDGHTSQ